MSVIYIRVLVNSNLNIEFYYSHFFMSIVGWLRKYKKIIKQVVDDSIKPQNTDKESNS